MSKALHRAIERRAKAELAVHAIMVRDYPKGAPIRWLGTGAIYNGIVLDHGHGDRIKVTNDKTGAELWIYAYRITSRIVPARQS